MTNSAISTGNIAAQSNVIVGHHNQMITNIYHSADWQRLIGQRDKLLERIGRYPEDADFRQELAQLLEQMEDFKRDVLKLAEDFQRIPLNTQRLKLAKQHFDEGDYQAARAVLNAEEMTQEQDALLKRQQDLQAKQADVQQQLDDKASEFLLKAQLTAIDYRLGGQRIATTSQYFEQALKSGRTPERLFKYAKFLQENNQRKEAETLYREALDIRRTLAKANPDVYLPTVAGSLNNLANLVAADIQRRKEAEILYREALDSYRTLAKANPEVHLPDVAGTLNNLGVLVSADTQRRKEAETLYREALDSRRTLAKANPDVYLPDMARILGGFGYAYLQWGEPQQASRHLQEAADIMQPLAEQYPGVHGGLYNRIMEELAKTDPPAD